MNDERSAEILLVEDNPADIDLTRESLDEARVLCNLHVTRDGVEAMKFLQKEGEYADAPTPDLVLLDLNLPKKDGRDVLEECKSDEVLRRIPIVVLTSSQAEIDIQKAYDLHANSYVVKPVDLDQFVDIMESIGGFWLRVVRFATD
jgi:two-component system response regulator